MSVIDSKVRELKNSITNLCNDRNYNVTREIFYELKGILSALDSLKIDNMFLAASNEWRNKFDENKLERDKLDIFNLLVQGDAMLHEIKPKLENKNINNLQENEVQNIHFVAKERLRAFIKALNPYTLSSYNRIDNYAVDVGIKDRFKSIREELNQKNQQQDPFKAWMSWTDKTYPEAPKYNTPNWRDYTYGLRHDGEDVLRFRNKTSMTNKNAAGMYFTSVSRLENETNENTDNKCIRPKTTTVTADESQKSDTESWKQYAIQAGINIKFPEISEQQYRFTKPIKPGYKNFTINPQFDLTRFNRPFTSATYHQSTTEYKSRYTYPGETNELSKIPWVR